MPYYVKRTLQEMVPWTEDSCMKIVSISQADNDNGSPKKGDLIALNPLDPNDKWLVAEKYAKDNYFFVGETIEECAGP